MVLRLEVELRLLTDLLDHHEVILAAGRRTFDHVGDLVLQLFDLGLGGSRFLAGCLDLFLQLVGALQQRRAVLRGGLADLLAKGLLLRAQLVRLHNRRTALLIGGEQLIHQGRILPTGDLGGADYIGVFAKKLEINHADSLAHALPLRW